jgi:hypothetical protein
MSSSNSSSITATFINPKRFGVQTAKQKEIDYANKHYEITGKAGLRKRNIHKQYLKERKDVEDKLRPIIDHKKWDSEKEGPDERQRYNRAWDEIFKLCIEINRKYIPLFAALKKRCVFCKKFHFPEDSIQGAFLDKTLEFCNDDHLLSFSKLDLAAQEKLVNKQRRKHGQPNGETPQGTP